MWCEDPQGQRLSAEDRIRGRRGEAGGIRCEDPQDQRKSMEENK